MKQTSVSWTFKARSSSCTLLTCITSSTGKGGRIKSEIGCAVSPFPTRAIALLNRHVQNKLGSTPPVTRDFL